MGKKRVLIIYFSYSGQTRKLMQSFARGLQDNSVSVRLTKLKPLSKIQFPLSSMAAAVKMMVETFFQKRVEIEDPEFHVDDHYDLIILAGPTWSYNVSGPVLHFLDKYTHFFSGKRVLPIISCRGYWRTHYWQLRYLLKRREAEVLQPMIFLHLGAEPWRTIGVFLKLAGKMPESGKSWIGKYYRKFGHSRGQLEYARELGSRLAVGLSAEGQELLEDKIVIKNITSDKSLSR